MTGQRRRYTDFAGERDPAGYRDCEWCERMVPVRWPHTCYDAAAARRAQGEQDK